MIRAVTAPFHDNRQVWSLVLGVMNMTDGLGSQFRSIDTSLNHEDTENGSKLFCLRAAFVNW